MKPRTYRSAIPLLCACLIVALGFWRWTDVILAPANGDIVAAAKRPIGNNSDLYPRWLGARELLRNGRDPYSAEVTRDIQIGFYGRPINPRNPADPVEQEAFVYPIYVVFLMAPTVTLPFDAARVIFRWLLMAAIACSVPLWMYAVRFRTRWFVAVSIMMLAVSSFPAVEEYFQQNLAALVLLFLAAAAAAAVRNWLTLSGFLLALATMKPDTTGLVVLWFLLWALANWKERGRLMWSFAGSLAALVVAGEVASPHWIRRFVLEVRRYPSYGADPSILMVLLPRWFAILVSAALLIMFAAVCWRWRRSSATSENFGWALAWAAVVTLCVIPKLAAYNQLLLIAPLLMLLRPRAVPPLLSRALIKAAFACQAWQWLVAGMLAIASYSTTLDRLRSVAFLPLDTLLALPPITLLAVMANSAHSLSLDGKSQIPRVDGEPVR